MPEDKPKHDGPKGDRKHDGKDHKDGDGKRSEAAANYGFALAFMESDPELKKLFNQAVKATWTADRFIAQLRDTKWFKHHSANVRNAIMQETADPATYKANLDQMYSTVKDTWGSMFGGGAGAIGQKQMKAWAETAHRMGWSEAQLMDRMTAGLNYQKLLKQNALGGKAAEAVGQLNQLTSAYGINLGQQWKSRQLERLMEGDDTIGGVQQRVRDLAMHEYKAFADRIAGGETVQDIASPYMQKMADLLERNPNEITLDDKMIQRALKQQTPEGKPAAMDLATFADFIRKDKRWQYTDNAREQVSSVTGDLLRSFGLVS